jgi:hypothetical protein
METSHKDEIGVQAVKMMYELGFTEDEIHKTIFHELKSVLLTNYRNHIKEDALERLENTTSFEDLL